MKSYNTLRMQDERWTCEIYTKYYRYVERKKRIQKFGRTSIRDSAQSKVYRAERAAVNAYRLAGYQIPVRSLCEMQQRANVIVKSKTWKSMLVENKTGARKIRIEKINSRVYLGMAYYDGLIQISPSGQTDDVLIHELTHVVGNWHHDIRFRMQQIKLASRFICPIYAKILAKEYRNQGLKINQNVTIKTPEQWIDSYCHMKRVRLARK